MDTATEEIRQRADITDIVGQYVALRPAGNDRMKACCPFHDEKTPSFYVSREKGFFKCFGCGEGGDVFTFLQKIEGITFPEAKERLAQRYGVELKQNAPDEGASSQRQLHLQIHRAACEFFQQLFSSDEGWPAQDYARERGLTQETLAKFGIGYAPDAWNSLRDFLQKKHEFALADIAAAGLLIERERTEKTTYYDRFRHRLMFPIHDAMGRVIAFGGRILSDAHTDAGQAKYINSPESPLFKKSQILYAYHLARGEVSKRESLIITEGYMDAIALHEVGFANTVATLGTALTAQHITLLRRLAPKIIYLCFDGDSAGMKAALRSGPLFSAHNLDVRVVTLPAQDDPDTFIKRLGAPAFEIVLHEAKLLGQYRLEQAVLPYDWTILADRKNAVRAGATVIAEIPDATERDAYIIWLAERWAHAENVTEPERLRMLEDAVRSDVRRLHRRQFKSQNVPETEPVSETVQSTVQQSVAGVSKGVLGAQKALLGVMVNNPAWRRYIAEKLPLEKWTESSFQDIVEVLSEPGAEQWNSLELAEHVTAEQQPLITELVMSTVQDELPEERVVDDWIERVEMHWARQDEREILKLIQEKLARGDAVSEDEKNAYIDALRRTKRLGTPEENHSL